MKIKLKDIIKKQKGFYNQEQIARRVGISQGQLSNIFNGRRKASPELLNKINKAVGNNFSKN
jgi:transcriptional regulator with XRE-family HTH domain